MDVQQTLFELPPAPVIGGENEIFPTPEWCVHRLLERVWLPDGLWLEPCAGDGAIVRAVRSFSYSIHRTFCVMELREECRDKLYDAVGSDGYIAGPRIGDSLLYAPWPRAQVVMTNPPFSLALNFIIRALMCAPFVAMLLRTNFLESETRAGFFRREMPDIYQLPNRPSFSLDGATDSQAYAWFVWGPERGRTHGRIEVLATTPLEERRK